ncbi:hypothetical protein [Liquorilactobacillus satsumensis]|uniref:Prophage Lp2 protein 7 n=1 Tax=Liquorilactobacillus satsumensis DSM 16230 = JCM 12392 TaxID=1423801 RepID=A0A0R1V2F4_9LACO|nr:hypothetical protein [Liquorilactobacillus satsumensis]KRL99744.1 hypothetical protein FD50_GL000063 [Liquorilactobacillus satsumensis DSM 16230 = JCM 12392]
MKKIRMVFIVLLSVLFLVSCGTAKKADYTTVQAEQALNKGKSIDGKTVKIKVDKLVPNSAFGYNIETGKHLNFVSSENPKVKKGQSIIVKVKKVESSLGSYIITYSKE